MKKIVLSLALVAMLSLVGCAAKTPAPEATPVVPETTTVTPVAPAAEVPAETPAAEAPAK